jgi:phosphate-selective porin
MKKILFLAVLFFGTLGSGYSQEVPSISNDSLNKSLTSLKKDLDLLKNLKISGWVQAQYQVADTAGAKNFDGGDFPIFSDKRFMIRRGRLKIMYTMKNTMFIMQINGTERGVNLVEIFGRYSDPWKQAFSITAGVMNRPFSYEIQQSSSDRESPERSRFVQMTLPNERDLGAMLSYQPQKNQFLHGLKIDGGFYNGTGIAVPGTATPTGSAIGTIGVNGFTDFDSKKDFIGHASYYSYTAANKIKYGFGFSHYNGGYVIQNNKYFTSIATDAAGNKVWVVTDTLRESVKNKFAPRKYYGIEGLFSINTVIGTTTVRGEFYTGTQTARDSDPRSPQAAFAATAALYKRQFNAGYAYFIQRIAKSKHELVVKYEWYDPNSKVNASDLNGTNGMGAGEIKYTMVGLGYNLYLTQNVKFMIHYNIVKNEITKIPGFTGDLKDNIFTARMQYRF